MSSMMNACYHCKYSREVPGNVHIRCVNTSANVEGEEHGIRKGWFFWPLLFDPVWLRECSGFEEKER